MFVLPELLIQKVLVNGFAKISSNPSLLDDLFAGYPAEMLAEAKTYMEAHAVPVRLNLPREGLTEASVAVLCSNDAEETANDTLGDFLHELKVGATDDTITEYRGIAKRGSYQLFCLASDPRLAMYLGYIIEALLILNTDDLQREGMENINLATSDLRFEEQYLPEFSNSRVVTLSCLHYHAVPVTEKLLTQFCVFVELKLEEET